MSREAGCRERLSNGVRQLDQLGTRGCRHPAKADARSIRPIDVDTMHPNAQAAPVSCNMRAGPDPPAQEMKRDALSVGI